MEKEPLESAERRRWLLQAFGGTLVATIGALLYPVVRFLSPRRGAGTGAAEVVAPYKANELKAVDGKWPKPFNLGGKPCLLVKTKDGEVRAFNAVCTHVDCTVEFRHEKGDIFCNCHNGVYDLAGRNVSGPPPRPLEQYKVTLRGTPGQEEIIVNRQA